jgi:environmental stress-induced protein Ves
MRIQRSAEHRVVPWANGLGVTADVFLGPAGADDWTWRLSIADVSDDLPFSYMPGIDRHIVVAQGEGMALTIDGAPEHRMDRSTPPLSFAGESATTCRLLDGPIADLNLMLRRGRATGGLRVVAVPPAMAVMTWPGDVAVVVLDGSVNVGPDALTTFDAVLLQDDSYPVAALVAGAAGARVAVATVNAWQPICGTAWLAIERLRDGGTPPPD